MPSASLIGAEKYNHLKYLVENKKLPKPAKTGSPNPKGTGNGNYYIGLPGNKGTSNIVTASSSLPTTGEPNSTARKYGPNGKVVQERKYGPDGKAEKDTDYDDHGNPKQHPDVPHEHDWDWSKDPPRQPAKPVPGPAPITPTPNPYTSGDESSTGISAEKVGEATGIAAVGTAIVAAVKWLWDTWNAAGRPVFVP